MKSVTVQSRSQRVRALWSLSIGTGKETSEKNFKQSFLVFRSTSWFDDVRYSFCMKLRLPHNGLPTIHEFEVTMETLERTPSRILKAKIDYIIIR